MPEGLKTSATAAVSLTIFFAVTIIQTQTGCGQETTPAPSEQKREAIPAKEIADRALKIFASTMRTGDSPFNSISGVSLARMLSTSEERSRLFLLDTRTKADYDRGHIEGSMQVDFGQWAAPENLARYPRDRKLVVIDYLDDYGGEIAGGLRMLGYDAITLRGGINGWSQGFMQAEIMHELSKTDYPAETTPAEPLASASGMPFEAPSDTDYRLMAEKANSIFSGRHAGSHAITAEELGRLLQAEEDSRPFVLDVRQRVDFDNGHIPGAVNMPFQALGVQENWEKLPRDRKIVVTCVFGSMASQVVTILRMLDYDAVLLKHSMMSWNGFGKNTYLEYIQAASNPVAGSP